MYSNSHSEGNRNSNSTGAGGSGGKYEDKISKLLSYFKASDAAIGMEAILLHPVKNADGSPISRFHHPITKDFEEQRIEEARKARESAEDRGGEESVAAAGRAPDPGAAKEPCTSQKNPRKSPFSKLSAVACQER